MSDPPVIQDRTSNAEAPAASHERDVKIPILREQIEVSSKSVTIFIE